MRTKIANAKRIVEILEEQKHNIVDYYGEKKYNLKFKDGYGDAEDSALIIKFIIGNDLTLYFENIAFEWEDKLIVLDVKILEAVKKIAKMKP